MNGGSAVPLNDASHLRACGRFIVGGNETVIMEE